MGIPKFFRYISERWPMISQLVNDSQIPEFDNLYLDMNSILHDDVTHHLSEEQMFVSIFNYIEHVFELIRPKKFFFMAIDGVAPRAKMNQQRSRRFRSALDAEVARKKAREAGLVIPDDPFDSNAITPGTEFMAKLTTQLKYFIHRKVSEDTSWQNIEVVLSGHEVPGEGEHKIMEQIRVRRAQPDYSPDVRHCLYGLDADLIMLGLLSHDPHFALLREEVTFGPRSKKSKELTDQKFFLLHLSLLREYIELEFEDVQDIDTFPFDFDRILDDFILISFFMGNDFLPELPSLLISDGAIPLILQTYKRFLRKTDGYINDGGIINFQRMAIWLDELSRFEHEKFEELAVDLEWFNRELDAVAVKTEDKRTRQLLLTPREKELTRQLKPLIISLNNGSKESPSRTPLPQLTDLHDTEFVRELCAKTYTRLITEGGLSYITLDSDGISPDETSDEENQRLLNVSRFVKKYENAQVRKQEEVEEKQKLYDSKFDQWRNGYYKSKFGISLEDGAVIKDVAENYLEGLQWVLLYYYRGVASWGWYYRYHYAPKISDIRKGMGKKFIFNLGHPFKPFEQLMGVLPERSKALVPHPYRSLMSEENSPIIDFYPKEFTLDMNGKKSDWEAVVKIPFVDEKRLLAALGPKETNLTPEEKKRNTFGKALQFVFNPQVDSVYPSSLPGIFLDIPHSHCIEVALNDPSLSEYSLKFGLIKDVKLGVKALGGFPSLKTLAFTAGLEKAGVQVFQQPSRNESLILTLENAFGDESSDSAASKLLGESIFVGWPYLREAKVISLSDELFKYELDESHHQTRTPHPPRLLDSWHKNVSRVGSNYFNKEGVKVGRIELQVHVRYLKGLKRTPNGAYKKDFGLSGDEEHVFPIQTIVEDVINKDERFIERESTPVCDEFPMDSQALFLGPAGYGNPVTITGHGTDNLNIMLMKLERAEPAIGSRMAEYEKQSIRYFASYDISKMLGIHPLVLSRITSKFLVECDSKRLDIGLNLKFEARRLKVLHYSRRSQRGWDFSTQAVELIRDYMNAFPHLFKALNANIKSDIPDFKTLLKLSSSECKELSDQIRKWIKNRTIDNSGFETVSLESEALSSGTIKKIEAYIIKYFENADPVKALAYNKIPRAALLSPDHAYHELRSQKFSLGDRVVSALSFGKVKLFNRGTVIGTNSTTFKVSLDVLFDHPFDAGSNLGGKITSKRGLTVDAGSVINLTNRQLVYHTKKSLEAQKIKAKSANQTKFVAAGSGSTNVWQKPSDKTAEPKTLVVKRGSGSANYTNSGNSDEPIKPAKPTRSSPSNATKEKKITILKKNSPESSRKSSSSSSTSSSSSSATTSSNTDTNASGTNAVISNTVADSSNAGNEKASKDLLSMLHGSSSSNVDVEKDVTPLSNEEILNNIKPVKNQKQSQKNLLGAVYGQYTPNPPAPPAVDMGSSQLQGHINPVNPFSPPFIPGMMIPSNIHPSSVQGHNIPQDVDVQASADLLAALNVGNAAPNKPLDGGSQRGGGSTRGRGGFRGRGRGRGSKTRGTGSRASASQQIQ